MMDEKIYQAFLNTGKICTDTRKDVKGSLFFAMKGDRFDGNTYVADALSKGASYAVLDNESYAVGEGCLLVDDTCTALGRLAARHRRNYNIPLLALTGTNGKTTTKELINAVLSTSYNCISTQGNFNNEIGLPLTILKISSQTQIAVLEMGAAKAGDINYLCNIAMPSSGLITNIGKAHLQGFGSPENVIKVKSELYNYLLNHNGVIFQNISNTILSGLTPSVDVLSYGLESSGADVFGKVSNAYPYLSVEVFFKNTNKALLINTRLSGTYNLENVLAACRVGMYFNIPPLAIKKAIENYKPSINRSQIYKSKHNTLILDAYNANPSSMEMALDNIAAMESDIKILILGDMLELGAYSIEEHNKIYEKAKSIGAERAIFIGSEFCNILKNTNEECYFDVDEACERLKDNGIHDALILFKGSRGVRLETLRELF